MKRSNFMAKALLATFITSATVVPAAHAFGLNDVQHFYNAVKKSIVTEAASKPEVTIIFIITIILSTYFNGKRKGKAAMLQELINDPAKLDAAIADAKAKEAQAQALQAEIDQLAQRQADLKQQKNDLA